MKLPDFVIRFIRYKLTKLREKGADEIIGHNIRWRKNKQHTAKAVVEGEDVLPERPFLYRWFLWPKNKYLNAYLHHFVRDDEDRALHDHPWPNLSILLASQYIEHTIDAGGIHKRTVFKRGDIKFRTPYTAHRVELTNDYERPDDLWLSDWLAYAARAADPAYARIGSWSLFITGPVMHVWGFHCPETGWRSSAEFHEKHGCDDGP